MAARPDFVNLEEAAQIWGVEVQTIRRRIADGTLTGYRLPKTRALRVDRDELYKSAEPVLRAS
ncbi:excisionase family DNA binding protein [Rhodococcus sp. UYP5]